MNHIAKDWGEYGFAYPFAMDWERLPEFRTFQNQLISIVRSELAQAKGLWGFKDPRTCRLLPLWKQIFAELNLEPLYVLAVRDPSVVVESLLKLYPLDPLHAELVWMLHYLDAIRDTEGELRIIVDYDRWFTEPRSQAQAVAKALDLTWPADDGDLVSRLTQRIRPDLRHSKTRRPCSLPFVKKIHKALQQCAATRQASGQMVAIHFRHEHECLGAALELFSGGGKLALALGNAEFQAGNFEAALEAYTRAIRLQPRLASAHAGKAFALHSLGRLAEALPNLNQALALDPADPLALKVQAAIDLQREKEKQAAATIFCHAVNVVAAPPIAPAPLRSRKGRVSSQAVTSAPGMCESLR